jgi:hypothetical protein
MGLKALALLCASLLAPVQASLQDNIEIHFHASAHMIYAHEPDLNDLHADVAAFIERTKNAAAN